MGSKDVKLVSFWASPFSKRVEWAFKLKGVEYEYVEQDIFNKSSLLLELNPVHNKIHEQEKALSVAREAMEKIEVIKGKRFFGGENIGYLDIALGWISYWIPVWEEVGSIQIIDPLKCSATTAWMTNFLSHPVIKDTLPPRHKMLDFLAWVKSQIVIIFRE